MNTYLNTLQSCTSIVEVLQLACERPEEFYSHVARHRGDVESLSLFPLRLVDKYSAPEWAAYCIASGELFNCPMEIPHNIVGKYSLSWYITEHNFKGLKYILTPLREELLLTTP